MPKLKKYGNSVTLRHRRRLIHKEIKSINNINLSETTIVRHNNVNAIQSVPNSKAAIDASVATQSKAIQHPSNAVDNIMSEDESDCSSTDHENNVVSFPNHLSTGDSIIDSTPILNENIGSDLRADLRDWALSASICHTHIRSLLKILRKHGHNLPSDPRTLLETSRKLELIHMNPGMYYHFGLSTGLVRSILRYYPPTDYPTKVKLNINIDGLPLTKSSASQFWPILAAIQTKFHTKPFIIGIYHGHEKPKDSNEFLKYFTSDFENISKTGLIIGSTKISVSINAFICDAPAKAFVTCTKGHNAYFGCSKCSQEGEYIENRVTFPEINARLRTNESFRLRLNEEHHKDTSILESLFIGMVSQFPLDPLHLGLLGVTKKLIQFSVKGKYDVRMSKFHLKRSSDHLLSICQSIPKEFARKPRALADIDRFKGTELRQILLYTGPIIFRENLTPEKYNHFLTLSVAFRLLSSTDLSVESINYSRSLLQYFVENFALLYGAQHVSYNIHNLIHLCDDVILYGPLDQFSAFKFENYMSKIKKMVKTSSRPLQQLINRSLEESRVPVRYEKKQYPVIKYFDKDEIDIQKNIKSVQYENYFLSPKTCDNCVCLKDKSIMAIERIYEKDNIIYLNGKKYLNCKSFFKVPCDSEKLGIKIINERSHQRITVDAANIKYKCMKLKLAGSENVIMPLLHHQEDD